MLMTSSRSTSKTLRPIRESYLTCVVTVTEYLLLMPTRHMLPLFRTLDRVQYGYDFAARGRRVYEEHNANVRALAPSDRFLEYHVREGWAPLCAFLGREPPEDVKAGGTPHLNNSASFVGDYANLNYDLLLMQGKRLLDVSAYAALVVVVAGATTKRWGFKWSGWL